MPLLLLIMTLAWAAKPSICFEELSDHPLSSKGRSYWLPTNFLEGAVRPGLLRFQDDLCRCLPKRPSQWPNRVMGYLWVQPNKGRIRIQYVVNDEKSSKIDQMLGCMGEPKFSVKPMPYKSDMIFTDGREAVFPRYPILVVLKPETEQDVPPVPNE